MAKEHIELLNTVRKIVLRDKDITHVYICSELSRLVEYNSRFFSKAYDKAFQDIKSVISCIFKGLSIGEHYWEEYGIASLFEKPLLPENRIKINNFRVDVIDALIKDFEIEELGCSPTGDY